MSIAIDNARALPTRLTSSGDDEIKAKKNSQVGNVRISPPKKSGNQSSASVENSYRSAQGTSVTDEEMSAALAEISDMLSAESGTPIRLPLTMGSMSLQDLIEATTSVVTQVTNKSTELSLQRIKDNGSAYQENFLKQIRDNLKKIDDANQVNAKGKKANVVSEVLNWVVACVEVVSGAVKLAAGIISGNPLLIAGGAVEMAAGVCGIIKNILTATGQSELADKFGKAQFGLEIVSMAIDIVSVAQVVKQGVTAAKVAAETITTGVAKTAETAAEVGARAGATVVEEAAKEISIGTLKACKGQIDQLVQKLGSKMIDKIIAESAASVVKTMVKNETPLVAEVVCKKLTQEIGKRLAKAAIGTLARSPVAVTKGLAAAANQIHGGIISYQTADLNSDISHIDSGMNLRHVFMATLTEDSNSTRSTASNVLNQQSSAIQDAMQLSRDNPQYQNNF